MELNIKNAPPVVTPDTKFVQTTPPVSKETISSTKESHADSANVPQLQDAPKEMRTEDLEKTLLVQNIKAANKKLAGTNTELHYAIHEKSKQVMVSVINSETKEIIRQIPAEKVLDTFVKMLELAGFSLDTKG